MEGKFQEPAQLIPVLKRSVSTEDLGLVRDDRKNHKFLEMRDAHGKTDCDRVSEFEYT